MTRPDVLRIALAVVVAAGIAATVGAVSMSQDRPGLPVGDLARVGDFSDAPDPLSEHAEWSFAIFAGERTLTEADLRDRFTTSFSAGFTAGALNASIEAVLDQFGRVDFVRYQEFGATFAMATGVEPEGYPFVVPIEIAPDGRMSAWGLDDMSAPPRVPGWQAALGLLAMWLFIVAGLLAIRSERLPTAWVLLSAALGMGSAILVLSNAPLSYGLGRSLPAVVLVAGVWLLLRRATTGTRLWVGVSIAAATLLAIAPALRDSTRIGHPAIPWALVDSPGLYRSALAASGVLGAIALLGVAVTNVRHMRSVGPWRRSPIAAGVLVASVWAAAQGSASADYWLADGIFAAGALGGVSLGSLVAIPVVVAFQAASSRWDRPELANLVVDLGSGDLQNGVATALEDPSVSVLSSPDGEILCDESGVEVAVDGSRMAKITKEGKLIGGLLLGEETQPRPEQLHAVTAAVGMALELRSLNEQVLSQLAEVEASRARIVAASDAARRQVERDLHDGAQQQLVALGLDLQRARRTAVADGNDEIVYILDSAVQLLRDTIADIRHVARGSDPPLLAERGLDAAVDTLVERSPLPVSVDISGSELPSDVARTVYFVVAESLTNVAKHSYATRATVRIAAGDGAVVVEVSDDGIGGATVDAGGGLQGLDDRTAAQHGSFYVESHDRGTLVRAVLPCE